MRSSAVLLRDATAEVVHYADRLESVRHRGLRQAFQALNPGLLICHPDTFQVRYANASARAILDLENVTFPVRLPEVLTMARQEEYCEAERRTVACYQTSIESGTHDVRAFPVYTPGSTHQVESVLVVLREYNDVSWSLYEMLDRLPIAIAAITGQVDDIRYLNRRALAELHAVKGFKALLKRGAPATADTQLTEALIGVAEQAPEAGEGRAEVQVGRSRVDMHFSRLGANDGSRLLYWDPRGLDPVRH
jgi:hypothetical protein